MARGQDTSKGRDIGPGSSLHAQIAGETRKQEYMFGVTVGTQDDGKFTKQRPTPGSFANGESYKGAEGSRPVFHGAEPNAIKLATMKDNYSKAMAGLMIPPSDNARQTQHLVDMGMRESDGVEHPVRSWVDESIKRKP